MACLRACFVLTDKGVLVRGWLVCLNKEEILCVIALKDIEYKGFLVRYGVLEDEVDKVAVKGVVLSAFMCLVGSKERASGLLVCLNR